MSERTTQRAGDSNRRINLRRKKWLSLDEEITCKDIISYNSVYLLEDINEYFFKM
jgi:hypothetical protein